MAEETFIYRVEYDTQSAQQNIEALVTEQVELREEAKQIAKLYKDGELSLKEYGSALALNQQALKRNSKELQSNQKQLEVTSGSLNEQRQRLSQLRREWANIDKSTKEGRKQFNLMAKEINNLNEEIKESEEASGDFRRSVGDYTNSIREALASTTLFGVNLGQAATAMGLASKATTGMTASLRLFTAALAGTGIGLLLIALGSLVAFFTRSQRGMDLFSQATAGLGAAVDVIIDRVARLGEILYNVFSGNQSIVEGAKAAAGALKGIGDELEREVKIAAELERRSQELRRSRLAFVQTEAALAATVERTKFALEDTTKTEEERLRSGQAALTVINSLADLRRQNLEAELAIIKERIKLRGSDPEIELLEEQARLQAEISQVEEDRFSTLTEVNNAVNALRKEQSDKAKKAAEDAANAEYEAFKERTEKISRIYDESNKDADLQLAAQRAGFDDFIQKNTAAIQKFTEKRMEADQKALENKKRLDAMEIQLERDKNAAKAELALSALDLFIAVSREQSAAAKIAATAQAIINTYLGASQAIATYPPPLGQILAIATVLQGLAYVAKINGVQFAQGGVIPGPRGGIARGRSHAQGGIRSGPYEIEGGEVVLTKAVSSSPYLLGLASEINQAAGGAALGPSLHMRDGGYATRYIDRGASEQLNQEAAFERVITRQKTPIVLVKDIRKGVDNSVVVENKAKVG